MGNWVEVQQVCPQCRGDGTLDSLTGEGGSASNSCPYCKGEGYEPSGRVKMKALDDKLDAILEILNQP